MKKLLLIASLALAGAFSAANAQPILANQDTYIYDGAGTANYGTASDLHFKKANGYSRIIYLQFDLGAIDGSSQTDASLRLDTLLNAVDKTTAFSLYGIAQGSETTWIESGAGSLTWDNSTSVYGNTTALIEAAGGVELQTGTIIGGADHLEVNSANLLNFVQADTDKTLDFVLISTGNTGNHFVSFHSSEETTDGVAGPTLTVIPEPASVGMLGIGALVALLLRRMRA